MMISTKGRYALRVMLDLAAEDSGFFLSLKDVAQRQDISVKYLEAIMAMLNRAGLVRSQRGKVGGYQLSRPAAQITVEQILRCTEGSLSPVSCPSLEGTPCVRAGDCLTLPLWQALDRRINGYLSTVSLEDVLLGKIKD